MESRFNIAGGYHRNRLNILSPAHSYKGNITSI